MCCEYCRFSSSLFKVTIKSVTSSISVVIPEGVFSKSITVICTVIVQMEVMKNFASFTVFMNIYEETYKVNLTFS